MHIYIYRYIYRHTCKDTDMHVYSHTQRQTYTRYGVILFILVFD